MATHDEEERFLVLYEYEITNWRCAPVTVLFTDSSHLNTITQEKNNVNDAVLLVLCVLSSDKVKGREKILFAIAF